MTVHHRQDYDTAKLAQEFTQEFKGIRVPFDSIPVIDLTAFRNGSDKISVADQIGRAARDVAR